MSLGYVAQPWTESGPHSKSRGRLRRQHQAQCWWSSKGSFPACPYPPRCVSKGETSPAPGSPHSHRCPSASLPALPAATPKNATSWGCVAFHTVSRDRTPLLSLHPRNPGQVRLTARTSKMVIQWDTGDHEILSQGSPTPTQGRASPAAAFWGSSQDARPRDPRHGAPIGPEDKQCWQTTTS